MISHAARPAHWWKQQTWVRLQKHLPQWIVARLEVYRPALFALQDQISQLGSALEAAAPNSIPVGLGKLTTVVLSERSATGAGSTIGAPSVPTPGSVRATSSGSKRVPGSVTKRGNPRVRAALVECAWRMVRFQPQYPPVAKRLGILCKGSRATGALRKKAIVAVARHLAVDLWRPYRPLPRRPRPQDLKP